jgi:amino acid transporter
MDWFSSLLNQEIFQLSRTPVTPLTLLMLLAMAGVAAYLGPQAHALFGRLRARSKGGRGRSAAAASPRKFGTFGGVFTPSILTILGVIMYLRLGWVTGSVGLGGTLLIVAVSHAITMATGLSVASIATNRTVGVGGAYYIISRSLGAPSGAAIGIPLFLGQALSVTFYIIGFTESLQQIFPGLDAVLVSTAICFVLTLISYRSAELAIKMQYLVMGMIAISLLSFFSGRGASPPAEIAWWNRTDHSFAEVFAVFFPAVTGIMAGVGMSGDLRDPRRALPRGTMLSIFVGLAVYVAFPVWLSLNAGQTTLTDNKNIVWSIARFPSLIYVGVWGATLSSALGSLLTAPRTLQALAMDGLLPRFLARGSGISNEPRVGIVITFLLAQTGIILGNLDVIAPVLTMFFLVTYGFINLACGLEKWASSPSFRPDFSVPAVVSLLGAAACFYVMSVIDMLAMLAAVLICGVIYVYAQRHVLGTTYGDARHGIWSAMVRSALHQLRRTEFHPQNWRPNLVIMGGDYERRPHLLALGSMIVQDRGIVTYFQLLEGSVADNAVTRRYLQQNISEQVAELHPHVFCRVEVVQDLYRGIVTAAQCYGVGSFQANTVLIGWLTKPERRERYLRMLQELTSLDRSLLLMHYNSERKLGSRRQIYIWWGGLERNGGLMLLIGFLIRAHHQWNDAQVHLLTIVNDDQQRVQAEEGMEKVIAEARVMALPRVILREGRAIPEIIHAESREADLAILGFILPGTHEETPADAFFERLDNILQGMPTTILVHSARNFESEPVLFS